MNTEQRLQELIAKGARCVPYARPKESVGLAAAHILSTGEVWMCSLWPEHEFAQVWRSFGRVEDLGHGLDFLTSNGIGLFTIAEMSEAEREFCMWKRWTTEDSEVARTGRAFVRALEVGVRNQVISNQ